MARNRFSTSTGRAARLVRLPGQLVRRLAACAALAVLTLSAGAATQNVYTWTGGAVGDSGNWFNPTNWSGPSGYGVPGQTHVPATPSIDQAYFASASNVAGTVTYAPGSPTVFSSLRIEKNDSSALTFNINGDMTVEHNNVADPDWWTGTTAIGVWSTSGNNLTFNVNSGAVAIKEANVTMDLAEFDVANGAAFIAFASSPSANRKLTLTVSRAAHIQGWFGTLGPSAADSSTRKNGIVLNGSLTVDGGTLYPDQLTCSSYSTVTVTNSARVRTRYGANGIIMEGYINKFYTNAVRLAGGSVTNVGSLRAGCVNTYGTGTPWPGISLVTVTEGVWFQGGATCIGDGRLGVLTVSGGMFDTPSDLFVGGARIGTETLPAAGVAFSGTLTVEGGTVSVRNPEALTLQTATTAGAGSGNNLYFGQSVWDHTYRGQRVVFDSLKSGGAGLEVGRAYWAADINSATDFQKTSFSVETNLTLTDSGATGTSYATGTGSNTYHTLPARLMVGNRMTFSSSASVMNTGTLNLVSGSLTVDELVATNGAASILHLNGGSLTVNRASDIDTGTATPFGNGTSSATLALSSGPHRFAHGLAIANNAAWAVGGTNAVAAAALSGDIVFEAGALLDVDFNAATNDYCEVTGTVTLPETATVVARAPTGAAPASITLMRASGGISGTAAGWPAIVVNGVTYKAAVTDDRLMLMKVSAGTLMSVL